MTPNQIFETVKKIDREVKEDKENELDENETKYRLTDSDFSMKFPVIFLKTLDGGLDMKQFSYMVSMASKVDEDKISQHDASVQVGEKLVDQYVKPSLNKIKK